MRGSTTAVTVAVALGVLVGGRTSEAGTLSGAARVFYGTTEIDDEDTDVEDEDYTVSWIQSITPWFTFNVGYRYNVDRSESAVDEIERRSSEPRVELVYSRPNLGVRLSFADRRTRGSNPADEVDITTGLAQIDWRPHRGPQFVARFRDESNAAADVALFGRDTDTRTMDLETAYQRDTWDIRYVFGTFDVDNNVTGLSVDQARHEVRFSYDDRFFDDLVTFGADGWVRRVDQEEISPSGQTAAEPIPPRQGLFAVDTTPEFGDLQGAFGLIDGDTTSPVPRIEIGGASTFRNLGLDLGFTRPVTRLEITVDALSAPGLLWEVYQSTDNLDWSLVPGVTSTFDTAFLRYSLEFPETTNRYFKAVNVSANSLTNVAVTEMRALLDVERLGRRESDSTTFMLNLASTLRPNDRVTGTFNLLFRNDEDVAGGGISRDTEELAYTALIQVELREDLNASASYRFSDFEENLEPRLERRQTVFGAGLDWSPLPTVRASLNASRREETERGRQLRRSDTLDIRTSMDIYEDLLLVSDVSYSDITDPFGGFDQTTLRWSVALEGRPTARWSLGGGWMLGWFDTTGVDSIDRRINFNLFTTWQIFPYLTFTGSGSFAEDDRQENLSQRYSLLWSPGRKLSASLYYQNVDSPERRETSNDGFSLTYRVNRRLSLFASLTRTTTEDVGFDATEIDSGRLGVHWTF